MRKDLPQTLLFDQFASDLVANGCGFRFRAKGLSMLPAIHDGDILHVQPLAGKNPRNGDIILLRSGKEFKAHRIVRVHGGIFTTRGDAGIDSDGEVDQDHILGLVVAKECVHARGTIRLHGAAARWRFWARQACRDIRLAFRG